MHRSGRNPLFRQLMRSFHLARLENQGRPAASPSELPRPGPSRRRFLAGAAAGVLAAYAGGTAWAAKSNRPRVAVVGGGIAGLNATFRLAKARFPVTLYEGSDHTGGRIQTNRGGVAPDVYTELGGEFIDTAHEDMLGLADLFDLDLIDTQAASETGLKVAYYGGGRVRSEAEVIDAFKPVAAAVDRDSDRLSDDITFDSHSDFDAGLDRTTLRDYFRRHVKTGFLYEILEAAYVNEFGLDLADQSALNFVETIGTDTSAGFQVYGESDQRYKIRGGNQQVVAALADAVDNHIELEHRLTVLTLRPGGEFHLTFDRPDAPDRTVAADTVVLCLPFTTLRDVELNVPLPPIKEKAIRELGYGTNAKLILGFQGRPWRDRGFGGDSYADQPYQSGWDSSREQDTRRGAYTIYPGGTKATDLRPGTSEDQAKRLLPGLDRIFPGVRKQWLGTSLRAYWPSNPFVKASYAAYRPGQWTGIRGTEGLPVGNLYFAGEHTSLDWQGFMNGGAESGRVVAERLIG